MTTDDFENKDEDKKEGITPSPQLESGRPSHLGDSDDIDEELLALAPPPPGIQQVVFIIVILGFSFLILGLFFPELKYFFKSFQSSQQLGEATNVDLSQVEPDSYVAIQGLPLVNRTVTFSTGAKWFSGDIYRKMAPLSGKQNLLVQWKSHNPDIPQMSDTLTPPADFEGRLKRREDLGSNYDKFWPFYDCLKIHPTSRCKYCIGRDDFNDCRNVFTCVENYPRELCSDVVTTSLEPVTKELNDIEKSLATGTNRSDDPKILAKLQKIKSAWENIEIQSELTRLDEIGTRAGNISAAKDDQSGLLELQATVLRYQIEALGIRLKGPNDKINSLTAPMKSALEQTVKDIARVEHEVAALQKRKSDLLPLIEVNMELGKFVSWVDDLKGKVTEADSETISKLDSWSVNPADEDGEKILTAVSELGHLLAIPKPESKETDHNATGAQTDTDTIEADLDDMVKDTDPAETDSDLGETDSDKSTAKIPSGGEPELSGKENQPVEKGIGERDTVSEGTDTSRDRVLDQLERVKARVFDLGRKVDSLSLGDNPEFEKWAGRTDVIGTLPEALRAADVFGSLSKIEKLLHPAEVPEQSVSLKKRYRQASKKLKEAQNRLKNLRVTSGVDEWQLVAEFEILEKAASQAVTPQWLQDTKVKWQQLTSKYVQKEFYPADLGHHSGTRDAMNQFIKKIDIPSLEKEISSIEKKYPSPMWVLLDKEKPSDNPWILFVYIIVPIMIFINVRKLLRFISAWRE